MEAIDRIGILIANTGTPTAPTPEAVREYLEQYLMHKRIMPMNKVLWWVILHAFILPKRSRQVPQDLDRGGLAAGGVA